MERILGLDPGLTRMGFGVVSLQDSGLELITYGLFTNPQLVNQGWNEHLDAAIYQLTDDFPRLLDLVRPSLIASEIVPPGKLGSNSELVQAAITVCKVIAYQWGIPWMRLGANTVKRMITGNDKASKAQIKNAVYDLFPQVKERHKNLRKEQKEAGVKVEGLPFDVTDGIAISICGARKYAESING